MKLSPTLSRIFRPRWGRVAIIVAGALLAPGAVAPAQTAAYVTGRRTLATRADLETAAAAAEQLARSTTDTKLRARKLGEAAQIRQRLKEGDFQPGHRIFLSVYSDSALVDTFTVRADRNLLLPNLEPISLVGVLDSELEGHLTKEIGKYVRNPTLRAEALMQVSITGAVGRPGFYPLVTDVQVSDAIMAAGGPTHNADMRKIQLRRGGKVAVEPSGVQEAIRVGLTLADIGARPGDEVFVPDRTQNKWARTAGVIGGVSGFLFGVIWLVRSI